MIKIYCRQTAKRLYYTEDIAVEDYGDDRLECTGSKLITLYEITNNEPNQIDLIGLDLEDDSYQEVYDYLHNKYENFEIIKL
jgi:hypothetical protein